MIFFFTNMEAPNKSGSAAELVAVVTLLHVAACCALVSGSQTRTPFVWYVR